MAGWFLKLKKISGGEYVYLCRNYREAGAHRREQVYLGRRDPEWRTLEDIADVLHHRPQRLRKVLKVLKEQGNLELDGVGPKARKSVSRPEPKQPVGPKRGTGAPAKPPRKPPKGVGPKLPAWWSATVEPDVEILLRDVSRFARSVRDVLGKHPGGRSMRAARRFKVYSFRVDSPGKVEKAIEPLGQRLEKARDGRHSKQYLEVVENLEGLYRSVCRVVIGKSWASTSAGVIYMELFDLLRYLREPGYPSPKTDSQWWSSTKAQMRHAARDKDVGPKKTVEKP